MHSHACGRGVHYKGEPPVKLYDWTPHQATSVSPHLSLVCLRHPLMKLFPSLPPTFALLKLTVTKDKTWGRGRGHTRPLTYDATTQKVSAFLLIPVINDHCTNLIHLFINNFKSPKKALKQHPRVYSRQKCDRSCDFRSAIKTGLN